MMSSHNHYIVGQNYSFTQDILPSNKGSQAAMPRELLGSLLLLRFPAAVKMPSHSKHSTSSWTYTAPNLLTTNPQLVRNLFKSKQTLSESISSLWELNEIVYIQWLMLPAWHSKYSVNTILLFFRKIFVFSFWRKFKAFSELTS